MPDQGEDDDEQRQRLPPPERRGGQSAAQSVATDDGGGDESAADQEGGRTRPGRDRGGRAIDAGDPQDERQLRQPQSDERHGPAEHDRAPSVATYQRGEGCDHRAEQAASVRPPPGRRAAPGRAPRRAAACRWSRARERRLPARASSGAGRPPTTREAGAAAAPRPSASSRAVAERPRHRDLMPRRAAPTASTAIARMAVASHSRGTNASAAASSRTASQVAVHRLPSRTARSTSRTISGSSQPRIAVPRRPAATAPVTAGGVRTSPPPRRARRDGG